MSRGGSRVACLAGVLALGILLVAVPAGRRPFWSSDEARFALLGQDVLDSGRWLVAEIRGERYLNKPQLFFWSVALASAPAGRVTERTAAIPGALASVAAVAGVIAVGARVWGWRTGALAALILATTALHFEMAHQVVPDMALTACLVWALYFLLAAASTAWAPAPVAGFYACVAVGLLMKGPQALVALAAAAVGVAATDGGAALRRLRIVPGLALVAALAALMWILPYQQAAPGRYEQKVIGGHYVTWILVGPVLARVPNLLAPLGAFMPWTPLLAVAAAWSWPSRDPMQRRLVLWTVTLWLLTALSGTFRSRYMLPVMPALALLVAAALTAPLNAIAGRVARWAMAACAALAALAAVTVATPSLLAAVTRTVQAEDRPYLPATGVEQAIIAILAAGGAAALAAGAWRRAYRQGALGLGLAMAGVLAVVGVTYPPRYTAAFDVRPLAAAAAHASARGRIIGHPDLRLSYDVYLPPRVAEMPSEAAVRERLGTQPVDAFVMSAARWEALAPAADPAWRVLASRSLRDREMVVVGGQAR